MKECSKVQEILMDGFFEDIDKDVMEHVRSCRECAKLYDELNAVKEKMSILDNFYEAPPAEIEKVLDIGEGIMRKRRNIKDLVCFILIALTVLSAGVMSVIYLGLKPVLIVQSFVYLNLPIILIPVLRFRNVKEEAI